MRQVSKLKLELLSLSDHQAADSGRFRFSASIVETSEQYRRLNIVLGVKRHYEKQQTLSRSKDGGLMGSS